MDLLDTLDYYFNTKLSHSPQYPAPVLKQMRRYYLQGALVLYYLFTDSKEEFLDTVDYDKVVNELNALLLTPNAAPFAPAKDYEKFTNYILARCRDATVTPLNLVGAIEDLCRHVNVYTVAGATAALCGCIACLEVGKEWPVVQKDFLKEAFGEWLSEGMV